MPASLASLVGQPAAPDQQSIQGGDNTAQPQSGGDGISSPGLSSLVRQQLLGSMTGGQGGGTVPAGGAPGGGQPQQQQQKPPPNAEETMALFRHLMMFQVAYKKVMHDPDFGTGDIKGPVMEMMADMVGEGLVTLPQVMDQLKQFPTQPLQQRQWIEKQFDQSRQGAIGVLATHAQAFPQILPWRLEEPKTKETMQRVQATHGDIIAGIHARHGVAKNG